MEDITLTTENIKKIPNVIQHLNFAEIDIQKILAVMQTLLQETEIGPEISENVVLESNLLDLITLALLTKQGNSSEVRTKNNIKDNTSTIMEIYEHIKPHLRQSI